MDPKEVNEDRFKYIAEHFDNEWVVRTAVRLSEKFSVCGSCLQTCTRMAYVLYLLGKTDLALVAASAVEDVPFENDYDCWTWVEALLVLKSRVERMNGDASLQTRLRTVVKPAVLGAGNDLQRKVNLRVFNRKLRGETLPDAERQIRQAVEEEDPIGEFGSRFAYHLQLCGIAEFGGSEVFPVEAAECLIADNQERLRQLLDAFMADNPKALGAFLSLR